MNGDIEVIRVFISHLRLLCGRGCASSESLCALLMTGLMMKTALCPALCPAPALPRPSVPPRHSQGSVVRRYWV